MLDNARRVPNLDLGTEWALLEMLCLGVDDPLAEDEFARIIESERLDWGELLEQAIRHKLLLTLASQLRRRDYTGRVPCQIMPHLFASHELHKHKMHLLYRELVRIAEAFDARGIRFACTKGITLEPTIYGGRSERAMDDMDFMVDLRDGKAIIECMSELGYRAGAYDWQIGGVKEPDRREQVMASLYPDHLPSFVLMTDDPVIRHVDIDFATNLTWANSPYHVPLEDALAELVPMTVPGHPGVSVPRLSPTFQFLFTALHLFREGWLVGWDEWTGKDVNLMKFGDVIRLLDADEAMLASGSLVRTAERYGIRDAILWVVEHADRALGTRFVAALGIEGLAPESWLASACAVGGKQLRWKGTMRERLECKNRRSLFFEID